MTRQAAKSGGCLGVSSYGWREWPVPFRNGPFCLAIAGRAPSGWAGLVRGPGCRRTAVIRYQDATATGAWLSPEPRGADCLGSSLRRLQTCEAARLRVIVLDGACLQAVDPAVEG